MNYGSNSGTPNVYQEATNKTSTGNKNSNKPSTSATKTSQQTSGTVKEEHPTESSREQGIFVIKEDPMGQIVDALAGINQMAMDAGREIDAVQNDFQNLAKETGTKVRDEFQELCYNIENETAELVDAIQNEYEKGKTAVVQWGDEVISNTKDFYEGVKEDAKETVEEFLDFGKDMLKTAENYIERQSELLKDGYDDVKESVSRHTEKIDSFTSAEIQLSIMGDEIGAVIENIVDESVANYNHAKEEIEKEVGKMKSTAESFSEKTGNRYGTWKERNEKNTAIAQNKLKAGLENMKQMAEDTGVDIADAGKDFLDATGDAAEEFTGNVVENVATGINYLKYAGEAVKQTYEEAGPLDRIQMELEVAGMVPGIGEPIDAFNSLIYMLRGRYGDAMLSLVACGGMLGTSITAGKWMSKAGDVTNTIGDVGKSSSMLQDATNILNLAEDSTDAAIAYGKMQYDSTTMKMLNDFDFSLKDVGKTSDVAKEGTLGASKAEEVVSIGSKTSYGKSTLKILNNTDNFTDNAIEHIFEGNVRRGKAGGYHYECIEDTAGKVISGTEVSINDLGVYKAQVEVNGIPKTANGGYSTFFPKDMKPQEVIDAINEAYDSRVFIEGTRNTYTGYTKNGLEIEMYINADGKIISAFPKE